jgi:hypothetical protein
LLALRFTRSALISVGASATVAVGMGHLIGQEWPERTCLPTPQLEATVVSSVA